METRAPAVDGVVRLDPEVNRSERARGQARRAGTVLTGNLPEMVFEHAPIVDGRPNAGGGP